MAGENREATHALEWLEALRRTPYAFHFFQALRRLECLHRDKPRMGKSTRLADDPIRLAQEPSLAFAPATLAAFDPGNGERPPKLYEYFRAGRPLFTVADPVGNTAEAAQAAGADAIADIRDAADIARRLESFLEGLRLGVVRGVAPEMAARNSRKARTAELAALLNSVTGSAGR